MEEEREKMGENVTRVRKKLGKKVDALQDP